MPTAIWHQASIGDIPGEFIIRKQALASAIRAAFRTHLDPEVLSIRLEPALQGYRATLRLKGEGRSPLERRKWVESQFYARWKELEKLTGITLYLRREWQG